MSTAPDDLAVAQARIATARARLFATLGTVQQRLKPAHLAQDAVESAAQGVVSVARKGAEAVRRRPFAAAAIAGAIGLVMARGRIADIVRSRNETARLPAGLKRKSRKGPKA